jgi:hypothetical protein
VNAGDDDVTFVFNGVTYKTELSGMRKGNPMIEVNIKFNGTTYKNELVVLKTVNDNINKNIAIGGSKFLHRISDKAVVVETPFILTDNTTNFEVPVQKLDESVNYENVINESEDIRLGGLKKLLTRYIQGHQSKYENDNWTLSYNGKELVECKENYAYFTNDELPYEDACKVAGVVEAFYGHEVDLSPYNKTE